MKYLAIRRFREFQHYRERNAPWIKLYSALLTNTQFIQMPEAAQAQLIKLWLITSQMGHPLPNNPRLLAGKIAALGRFYLPLFIELGFLTPCSTLEECEQIASKDASNALAECAQDDSGSVRASARSRERREVEVEGYTPPHSTGDAAMFVDDDIARRLPTHTDRAAYSRLISIAPEPETWRAEIRACLDGMPGHHPTTSAQAGEAIRDFLGNGAATARSLRQFRRYLQQAGSPRAQRNGERKPRRNGGDPGFDKIGGDE